MLKRDRQKQIARMAAWAAGFTAFMLDPDNDDVPREWRYYREQYEAGWLEAERCDLIQAANAGLRRRLARLEGRPDVAS
jgi:hypothetical protein